MLRFWLFLFSFCFYVSALKNCTKINDDLWKKELSIEFDDIKEVNENFYIFDRNCENKVYYDSCSLRENIQVKNGYAFLKANFNESGIYKLSGSEMITNKPFSYGRYEIRARLARGDFLESSSYSIPIENAGHVTIFDFAQNSQLGRRMFFQNRSQAYVNQNLYLDQITLPSQFHIYGIEWEPKRLRFFFDDNYTAWHNFSSERNIPQMQHIRFDLGVGGKEFTSSIPFGFTPQNWICPALILDYFRIYKRVENSTECQIQATVEDNKNKYFETNEIDSFCLKYSKVYKLETKPSEKLENIVVSSNSEYFHIKSELFIYIKS